MIERNASKGVILVSGGDGGIGTAIVNDLLVNGYRVSLGSLDVTILQEKFGPECETNLYAPFDAFDAASAQSWIDQTLDRFGQIDGLVNAIGGGRRVSILDDDDEGLDELFELYVKTPLRLTRLCLPHLEKCGRGRIVNIASLGGKRIRNVTVGYGVAKFAQVGLTHAIRTYGWDKGIRATAICPGWVRTSKSMKSPTLKLRSEEMIDPATIGQLVRTAIELPNNAAMAEMLVNCEFEDLF